jgi:hypothetical protein
MRQQGEEGFDPIGVEGHVAHPSRKMQYSR